MSIPTEPQPAQAAYPPQAPFTQQGAAPGYPVTAPPQVAAAPQVPGRGLAIAGLILAILTPPIGLILSIVALVKLRRNGGRTGAAIAGIVIGALFTIGMIIGAVTLISVMSQLFSVCANLGPGVWEVGGMTYTCG